LLKRLHNRRIFTQCVVAILGSLIVRWPLVGKWGNSDEAWYAAIAAYNVAHGKSPFECPGNNASPTIAVYQAMTTIGGPYHKVPLDLLTLLICAGVTVWVYRVVREIQGGFAALMAAAGFLICQSLWEGGTSNREWFALPFLIGNVHLLLRAVSAARSGGPPGLWRLFLAGIGFALACGMKEQSLPFLIVGPTLALIMRWQKLVDWRTACRWIAWYGLGSLLGLILIFVPHFYWGTSAAYLHDFLNRVAVEGGQNMVPSGQRFMTLLRAYGPGLILSTEGRSVILGFALLSSLYTLVPVVLWHRRCKSDSGVVLAVAYLASVVCVSGGGRFFDHYYLYLLPFAVPMIAIAAAEIVERGTLVSLSALPFLALAVTQAIWGGLRGVSEDSRDVSVALALSLLAFMIHRVVIWRSGETWLFHRGLMKGREIAVSVFFISLMVSLGHRQFLSIPTTDLAVSEHTSSLCQSLDALRREGDQIFVWGWQTRIYPASRMVPASQYVSTARVVHDFSKNQRFPEMIPATAEMHQMLRELNENRPRFVVDASLRTYSLSDPGIYELKRHQEMHLWLHDNYRLAGQFDDYRLFVRR